MSALAFTGWSALALLLGFMVLFIGIVGLGLLKQDVTHPKSETRWIGVFMGAIAAGMVVVRISSVLLVIGLIIWALRALGVLH